VGFQVSDFGMDVEQEKRHRPRHSGLGCLAVVIAFAVLAGGGYVAYSSGLHALKERFRSAADYSGKGTGSVLVEVKEGQSSSDIADTLAKKKVVKSAEAFRDAAVRDGRARNIQVGFYEMRHQMSAASALSLLIDPTNLLKDSVTFPEGWTARQTVAHLAKKTDFSARRYDRVLAHPEQIGLPSYAKGNPEGYLFPATYDIPPDATPRSILKGMVDRYKEASAQLDLEKKAAGLGRTPQEVMTVASLIQSEARFDKDFQKVSRVIYNRLDAGMPLQFDSTVHYAVGKDGSVGTSNTDRNIASPYNTYKVRGLPPTPIAAPGNKAIEAALNPADGPWMYFVTTNPDTGVTKFATTYKKHLKNVAAFKKWCSKSDTC